MSTQNVPEKRIDQQIANMAQFSDEKKTLIKRMYCKDCTDDEFELFLNVCQHTGLDPTMKQIHPVKRKSKDGGGSLTIQTSIDGLRLIADRTGNYVPGREPTFTYDKQGKLFSATSYIKKRTRDGTWHEVSATAIYSEYKPKWTNEFWDTKSHIMTAKCAEALALRKAFPAEMSRIHSEEEMHQASSDIEVFPVKAKTQEQKQIETPKIEKISSTLVNQLLDVLEQCSDAYKKDVNQFMSAQKISKYEDLPMPTYDKILKRSIQAAEDYKKEKEAFVAEEYEEAVNE